MIDISHVVTASPEQMEFIIEGMRNPMNSWDKSDSCLNFQHITVGECLFDNSITNKLFEIGPNDQDLMGRLMAAGSDHRKFMRMMPVYMRITAPLYWWKEFDTYKVSTVRNSCSTMHKIHAKPFAMEDFSTEHLSPLEQRLYLDIIDNLNYERTKFIEGREKDNWWHMIQMLPSSYNQTANVMLNYETLHNMYHSRKSHKLDEWVQFCEYLEKLPLSQLITE